MKRIDLHTIKHFLLHFFTAKRKGHDVHSPFAFQLCEEVFYNTNGFYDFEKLSSIREKLLNDGTLILVDDLGAGSKAFASPQRKIADIAARGISSQRQSELLYRLVHFLQPSTIVELGSSVGLNSLYLSSANKKAKVYSIEGSPALHSFAKSLASKAGLSNCEFICGHFDAALPPLLDACRSVDLAYIDGNHTYEATRSYFEMFLTKKKSNTVLVFDDIYWSEGMTRAWTEISAHPEVRLSIDTFQMGLIFFREEIRQKIALRIKL